MKSRNTRRCALFLIILMLISTTVGCQLAIDGDSTKKSGDILAGVFVTIGWPEQPVTEIKLDRDDYKIDSSGNISIINDNPFQANGIYEGVLSDEGNSIIFEGLDGYFMGFIDEKDEQGNTVSTGLCANGLHDVKHSVNVTDDGEINGGEATLYVSPYINEIIYVNPVYLREDGSYYTIIGNSTGLMASNDNAGNSFSQSIDSTIKRTVNGKANSITYKYQIHVVVNDVVDKILIKEINSYDEVLLTTPYTIESPDTFVLNENTDYVIVEEYFHNPTKGAYTRRTAYSFDSDKVKDDYITHMCNFAEENGVLGAKMIEFQRPE